jgi:radical S-adenosyl methionine domain-containing protein 2
MTLNDIQPTKLRLEDWKKIILELKKYKKFKKINFAGGEPLLVNFLPELLSYAKELGFDTRIITNGSLLDVNKLSQFKDNLDILGISVNSFDEEVINKIGRKSRNGKFMSFNDLLEISEYCRKNNILLKINTVVSKYNYKEKMADFINKLHPFRWKILQETKIIGQNDKNFDEYKIENVEFRYFVQINKNILDGINVVIETEDLIKGSYIMIDPLGRFIEDHDGKHNYSENILDVGVEKAFSQIRVSPEKFIKRGGNYN